MSSPSLVALALTFIVALASPWLVKPWLTGVGVIDKPNQRSSHQVPTLRGGGLAQLTGIVAGGTLAVASLGTSRSALILATILVAGVLMGVVGLFEDVRGLAIAARAGLQLLIGACIGLVLSAVGGGNWLWVPVVALGFAAYVNFTNFMDGINGISSLHGLVAGVGFGLTGVVSDLPWLTTAGFLTAAAFIAFLPWNLTPPGIFLGDSGSYLLGALLAATSIAALMAGVEPIAALAPNSIYCADAIVTMTRRLLRGERLFKPHRSHTYQLLTTFGVPHVAVAALVAAFTACATVIGLLVATGSAARLPSLVATGGLIIGYLFLPRLFSRGESLKPPSLASEVDAI